MRLTLGDLELISVSDGTFSLDGGAMFGVVPKVLWQKVVPADDRNRVRLGLRPLVVRGERTLIIDAGIGDKSTPKFADIYGLDRTEHLDHSLAAAGVSPDEIEIALASHLHFDHVGGFTARDASGRIRPRFPQARCLVRRSEWEDAIAPNERTRASYLSENFAPLAEAGVIDLVDEDATIMPGVRVRRSGGHTAGHQIVLIESGGRTAVFAGDLVPTTAHVQNPWIMAYDLFPLDTLSFKHTLLREAIEREYVVFFEHDPHVAAGYVREREGRRYVEPLAAR